MQLLFLKVQVVAYTRISSDYNELVKSECMATKESSRVDVQRISTMCRVACGDFHEVTAGNVYPERLVKYEILFRPRVKLLHTPGPVRNAIAPRTSHILSFTIRRIQTRLFWIWLWYIVSFCARFWPVYQSSRSS